MGRKLAMDEKLAVDRTSGRQQTKSQVNQEFQEMAAKKGENNAKYHRNYRF